MSDDSERSTKALLAVIDKDTEIIAKCKITIKKLEAENAALRKELENIKSGKVKLTLKSINKLEPPSWEDENGCPICRDPSCTSDHK